MRMYMLQGITNMICDTVMGWVWPDIQLVYKTDQGIVRYSGSHAAYDGARAVKMIRASTDRPETGTPDIYDPLIPVDVPIRSPSPDFSVFVNGVSTVVQDTLVSTRRPHMEIGLVVSTRHTISDTEQAGNYIKLPVVKVTRRMTLNDIRIELRNAIYSARTAGEKHLTLGEVANTMSRADYVFDSWTSLCRVHRDDGMDMQLVGTGSVGRDDNTFTTYGDMIDGTYRRNFMLCAVDGKDFRIIRAVCGGGATTNCW